MLTASGWSPSKPRQPGWGCSCSLALGCPSARARWSPGRGADPPCGSALPEDKELVALWAPSAMKGRSTISFFCILGCSSSELHHVLHWHGFLDCPCPGACERLGRSGSNAVGCGEAQEEEKGGEGRRRPGTRFCGVPWGELKRRSTCRASQVLEVSAASVPVLWYPGLAVAAVPLPASPSLSSGFTSSSLACGARP